MIDMELRLEEVGSMEQTKPRVRRYRGEYKALSAKDQAHLLKTVREVRGSDTALGNQAERDYAIIETFLNTGIRRAELAGLVVGDVRGKDKLYVRPEIAKRRKGRFVPLNVHVQRVLKSWIARKLERGERISDDAPLFVSRLGRRLSLKTVNDLVELWMRKAGFTTIRDGESAALYTVHSLRHSCGTLLEARGVSLRRIQKFLGHESIASTQIYTSPRDAEMAEAAEAAAV